MPDNALVALLQHLQIPRNATIALPHGEPFLCPTSGTVNIRYTVPGVEGEFHVTAKVQYRPPFRRAPRIERIDHEDDGEIEP